MQKCKIQGHIYQIDTPTFFNKDKPEVEDYYQPAITAILMGTDDWFYKRTHIFTHLKCEVCQKEEHIELPAKYLQTVMMDPGFRFTNQTVKRLQMTVGGETYTYDIGLSTPLLETVV